ncbi:ABC transporter substrate-binding protein [Salipaludibacillus sp. CUR1]|uniref:ABC transporter substrate-binding protein n=1 Tax=Salipaludibacillus sp. CUR1 TaxID=2820003 RepID=UPI001E31DC47|nr:ABC transporter substrate-binding protein [Salipaludibacillus sp. CUR1]MCE7791604.1 ABC transporter substrate-binding protein [Salipaludibacillus sp. CUR1]
MENVLKKWGKLTAGLAMAAALLTACGNEENNAGNEQNDGNNAVQNNAEENAAGNENANEAGEGNENGFPVTLTDSTGNEVTIDEEPETLVSLLPSNTEILFELGAGDRLIGVSEYCNYPEETADIDNVGAQDMDPELILSLDPDVAFVQAYHEENHADILNQYEEAGIDVIVVEGGNSFEEVYETIQMIGEATGTDDRAEEIVGDMEERLEEIKDQAADIPEEDQKKVWVEVAPSPDIFTTGQGTFMHEMLEAINAVNAAEEEEGWVNLNEEEIVMLNPDVIITTYGYYVDDPQQEVLSRDGWTEVPAVQNERIHDVDNDTVTRPGPRLIEGVETLAELVYPDVFE